MESTLLSASCFIPAQSKHITFSLLFGYFFLIFKFIWVYISFYRYLELELFPNLSFFLLKMGWTSNTNLWLVNYDISFSIHFFFVNGTDYCYATLLLQTDREVGGLVRNFQSSFYGKVICNKKKFLRIDSYTQRRGHAIVTSVVHIT